MEIPKLPNDIIIKIWSMAKEMEYKETFHLGNFRHQKNFHYCSWLGRNVYHIIQFKIIKIMPKTIRLIMESIKKDDFFYAFPVARNYRIKKDEKGEYIKLDYNKGKKKIHACYLKNLN